MTRVIRLEAKDYLHIRTVSGSLALRRTNSSPESLTPDEQLFGAKLFARHAEVVFQNRSNLSLREADAALRQWLKEAEENRLFKNNGRYLLPGIIFSILLCFGINGPGRPEFGTTGALLGLSFTVWSVAVCVVVFIAAQLWRSALGGDRVETPTLLWAIAASCFCVALVGVELIGVWLMGKPISPFVAGSFLAIGLLPSYSSTFRGLPRWQDAEFWIRSKGFGCS